MHESNELTDSMTSSFFFSSANDGREKRRLKSQLYFSLSRFRSQHSREM
jgi:hypothetical protein